MIQFTRNINNCYLCSFYAPIYREHPKKQKTILFDVLYLKDCSYSSSPLLCASYHGGSKRAANLYNKPIYLKLT